MTDPSALRKEILCLTCDYSIQGVVAAGVFYLSSTSEATK